MGKSIDLYSYDYNKLLNRILEVCKTNDKELVEKILLSCGTKIADRYIILNQELWDDCSCYYNVATSLERIFNIEDVFGEVFCCLDNSKTDKQELVSAMYIWSISEELDIKIPDEE